MKNESQIALDCPLCGESIYQALSWFRQSYPTCTHCGKTLAPGQFDKLIHNLEQAFDSNIDDMLSSAKKSGCCGH